MPQYSSIRDSHARLDATQTEALEHQLLLEREVHARPAAAITDLQEDLRIEEARTERAIAAASTAAIERNQARNVTAGTNEELAIAQHALAVHCLGLQQARSQWIEGAAPPAGQA